VRVSFVKAFAAEIARGALAKGKRVALVVTALILIDQTVRAFEAECAALLEVELQDGKVEQHIAPPAMTDAGQEGFHA
jgi:hypothetical protein